jgi:transcription initiation factor TFIIIB Brf1 subunit/transcription initiation factor TFIIB
MTESSNPFVITEHCIHSFLKSNGLNVCRKCGYVDTERPYCFDQTTRRASWEGDCIIKRTEKINLWWSGTKRTTLNVQKSKDIKNKNKYYRIKKVNNHRDSKGRCIINGIIKIEEFCKKYNLSKFIISNVKTEFVKIRNKMSLTGRSIELWVKVLTHIVCKQHNYEHTYIEVIDEEERTYKSPLLSLRTIAEIEDIPRRRLTQVLYRIKSVMNVKSERVDVRQRMKEFMEKLETRVELTIDMKDKMFDVIPILEELCSEYPFYTRDSGVIVSAFFYLYQKEFDIKLTQYKLAFEYFNNLFTEVTLRKYVKKIKKENPIKKLLKQWKKNGK